jgi:hypothetical protein
MGGKGGSGSSPDVVYVVLERGVAMDLLNALYIALGIAPKGEEIGGADAKGVKDSKSVGGVKGGKVGGSKGGGGKVESDKTGSGDTGGTTAGGKGK